MLEPLIQTPSSCAHAQTDRRVITNEFFDRQFDADVDVCRSCGERQWTAETRARFKIWIVEMKQRRRNVFQVQVYLPESIREEMTRFLDRFPGVSPSVLMRVMVTVYLSAHIRFPEFKTVLKRVEGRPTYQKFVFGRRKKTSVQFSPMAMLDIQSWAQVLKLAPHKILEDAVFKFLSLQSESDLGLREFWAKSLLPQVEVILRAS